MSKQYAFFKLNAFGVVDSGETVRLPDDETAKRFAVEMRYEHPVEVWAGKRRVGIIAPEILERYAGRTADR